MQNSFILALDQGTSSSRAILYSMNYDVAGVFQEEITQIYPETGWVEQCPKEIWKTQFKVAKNVISNCLPVDGRIVAICITNQRETSIVWDKYTGEPIYNAIVWQDKRTAEFCNSLKNNEWAEKIKAKTGLIPDSYFSATKLQWILSNVKDAKELFEDGKLFFGTVDSWLIWNLTNGVHATDFSNASRTMLFNITKQEWDDELLTLFEIPKKGLPEVKDSSTIFGYTNLFADYRIPIAGVLGDQQAALFGHACFEKGMAKNTYGTGCFILINTGAQPFISQNGLITTIAWRIDGKIEYALEGSVFVAGAAISWLTKKLSILPNPNKSDEFAHYQNSSDGVVVIPAFSGLGAPYWNMNVKGAILGLTQNSDKYHITRATLEAIAYRTKDVIEVMTKDSGIELQKLSVDGGASKSEFLMDCQANVLNKSIIRPSNIETSSLGVAYMASIALKLHTKESLKMLQSSVKQEFKPNKDKGNHYQKGYFIWKKAVQKLLECYETD